MSLLTALQSKDERLVETICASGASPNETEAGSTPMHIAAGIQSSNDLQLTKILLKYGGDPNIESDEKLTPVHIAVIWGKANVLGLLLRKGGDPAKKDEEGLDAWDYAVKYGRGKCTNVLRSYLDEEVDSRSIQSSEDEGFISIFSSRRDLDTAGLSQQSDRLSTCSVTSDLNRGFIDSSRKSSSNSSSTASPHQTRSYSSQEIRLLERLSRLGDRKTSVPTRLEREKKTPSPPILEQRHSPPVLDTPQAPPRRSKSIIKQGSGECLCRTSPYQSIDVPDSFHSYRCETIDIPDSCRNVNHPAPRIQRSYSTPSTPKIRFSPVTSSCEVSPSASHRKSKQKRSPLSRLTRTPSKTFSKIIAKISPLSSSKKQNNKSPNGSTEAASRQHSHSDTVRRRLISDRDRELLKTPTLSLDATSPDHCITTTKKASMSSGSPRSSYQFSPSNYASTETKPQVKKKIESPLRFLRQKSHKSVSSNVVSNSPSAETIRAVAIRPEQTVELSARTEGDLVSELSLPVNDKTVVHTTECCCSSTTLSTTSSGRGGIGSGAGERRMTESRIVFDATSTDNCIIVERRASTDNEQPSSAPLDKTLIYTSPEKPTNTTLSQSPKIINKATSTTDISSPAQITDLTAQPTYTPPNKPPRTHEYKSPPQTPVIPSDHLLVQPPYSFRTLPDPAPTDLTNPPIPDDLTLANTSANGGTSTPTSSGLHHRWPKKKTTPSSHGKAASELQQLTLCIDEVDEPGKDSGIGSASDAFRKRLPSSSVADSEESFHTCTNFPSITTASNLTSEPETAEQQLPTEVDSLLAKVSRMNLNSDCSSSVGLDASIIESHFTDPDSNVTLTECRLPLADTPDVSLACQTDTLDWKALRNLSICTDLSEISSVGPVTIPDTIQALSDVELARELRDRGDVPGPITDSTRRVYQIRLQNLQQNPQLKQQNRYSKELNQFVALSVSEGDINQWVLDMVSNFEASRTGDTSPPQKWREGNLRMSFNYLLLDPRTTKNLPARHHILDSVSEGEAFKVFLSSIFYIGKGKKTRPYQHFVDAIRKRNSSEKTNHIVDIWKSGHGVVSLHVFHNTLAVEAFTREACMVDTIGLKNLTNIAKCNYYGVASAWSAQRKRLVGALLLYKAFRILLLEGERQIKPADIRSVEELPSFLA